MRFCGWCGRDLGSAGTYCSNCGEALPTREEAPKTFSVILRGVTYGPRSRKRDTLLAVVRTRTEADAIVAEYRATGWTVDVTEGALPSSVHVPGKLEARS